MTERTPARRRAQEPTPETRRVIEFEVHRATVRIEHPDYGPVSVRIEGDKIYPSLPRTAEAPATQDVSTPVEPQTSEAAAPREKEKAIRVTGRLGGNPRVTETNTGKKFLRFALAEHHDGEQTTWHSVVFTAERAEKVEKKNLAKGQLVEVVAFRHERTLTDRAGQKRVVEELFGLGVSDPSKPKGEPGRVPGERRQNSPR